MWAVYTFIGYLALALLTPVVWAEWRVWRRARVSRHVTCPALGIPALVKLDPWYAVRMHALGNEELRVVDCSGRQECPACGQECLAQTGTA
jgi:hypothetical protein